jgi:succinate dehydrogenase / fumarate reductase cytochrome b subunit
MASPPAAVTKAKVKRTNLFTTAIGKKLIMAATGLSLVGFLFAHLAGNLLLLQGGSWFNTYATVLNGVPFLLFVELGLAAIVFIHAYDGYMIWKQNKAARGQEYYYKDWTKRQKSNKSKKSVASTTMMWTGIVLLVFMVGHVWHMKYHNAIGESTWVSEHYAGKAAPGVGVGDTGIQPTEDQSSAETKKETMILAQHVVLELKKPYVLVPYVLCMIAVTLHLYHAIGSSLQTIGAGSSKMGQAIWHLGRVAAVVVGGAFVLLPIYVAAFMEIPRKPVEKKTPTTQQVKPAEQSQSLPEGAR